MQKRAQKEADRKARNSGKNMLNDIGWKVPAWLERALRDQPDRSLEYSALVPIVSHFEALLETDAAQQPPLLNNQERGTVKGVLKEYLKRQKWLGRLKLALLAVFSWFSLTICVHIYRLERRRWEKKRYFKELHTQDNE